MADKLYDRKSWRLTTFNYVNKIKSVTFSFKKSVFVRPLRVNIRHNRYAREGHLKYLYKLPSKRVKNECK